LPTHLKQWIKPKTSTQGQRVVVINHQTNTFDHHKHEGPKGHYGTHGYAKPLSALATHLKEDVSEDLDEDLAEDSQHKSILTESEIKAIMAILRRIINPSKLVAVSKIVFTELDALALSNPHTPGMFVHEDLDESTKVNIDPNKWYYCYAFGEHLRKKYPGLPKWEVTDQGPWDTESGKIDAMKARGAKPPYIGSSGEMVKGSQLIKDGN
jgi:hypothetical protein